MVRSSLTNCVIYQLAEDGEYYRFSTILEAFYKAQDLIDAIGLYDSKDKCQLHSAELAFGISKFGFGEKISSGGAFSLPTFNFHYELLLAVHVNLAALGGGDDRMPEPTTQIGEAVELLVEAMQIESEVNAIEIERAVLHLHLALDTPEAAQTGINPEELFRFALRLESWADETRSLSTGDRPELNTVRQVIARIHQVAELWEHRLHHLLDEVES